MNLGVLYKCSVCGKYFDSENSRDLHLNQKHRRPQMAMPAGNKTCPECGKEFARKFTRDRHLANVHKLYMPKRRRRQGQYPRAPPTPVPERLSDFADDDDDDDYGEANIRGADAEEGEVVLQVPDEPTGFGRVQLGSTAQRRKTALKKLLAKRKDKGLQNPRPAPAAAINQTQKRKAHKSLARVRKYLPLLQHLSKVSGKDQKTFLNIANRDLIYVLCDCAHNCLKGCVKLSPGQKRSLHRYRHSLRDLTKAKTTTNNLRSKLKILQRGGFFGTFLRVAVPLLLGLLSSRK